MTASSDTTSNRDATGIIIGSSFLHYLSDIITHALMEAKQKRR